MDHDVLIGPLYEGITDQQPWSAFLERTCERFDALACSILFQAGRSPVPIASFRAGGASSYRARYWSKLYLVDPFVGLPPDTPITFADFSARHGGADDAFLAEIASPHILGIDITLKERAMVRFRLTRSNRKPDFSAAELGAAAALVPHLKRAFSLFLRLARAEQERDALAAAPELLGVAAVTVDCDAGVLGTNAAAAELLTVGRGVLVSGGRLVAGAPAANAALHESIRRAELWPRSQLVPIAREGALPLAAVVVPASSAQRALKPQTLVLLLDPHRVPGQAQDALARLLGLTGAEARLAVLLGQGLSLSEAADVLGVRMATVRAQLRGIFGKTGITRQSELVRVVLAYGAAGSGPAAGIGRSSTISRP